ncbi:hypothetical protein M3M33_13650, partial [Loigolactobacillus coryniformis]|uniref:hypothetical protein n=1 Tax=Loigolactobacillus coryniformis TaxID=1610 RepID=UPI00201A6DB5
SGKTANLVYIDEASVKALQNLSKTIKSMADPAKNKSLTKRMNAEIREAAEPMRRDIAQAAKDLNFERTSKQGGGYGSKARGYKIKNARVKGED